MATLSFKGAGTNAAVELDGQRIFPTAVRIHAKTSGTTAVFEVPILDCEFDGDVIAKIPDSTRDILISLGWTPPVKQTRLKCAHDGHHWVQTA